MFLTKARQSVEERMKQFDLWVKVFGYRAPTKADIVPGAELLMIDVERYMQPHNQGTSLGVVCSTRIKLDDEPIALSNDGSGKEVVFYHCTMPSWNGQCFVPLEEFCSSGYRTGCYENDHRWIIKA
ncbi:hypothetical protein K2Q00_02415 [Patescibacteria group bacterium]|nr:hypothetical protein [Patescibacteria group bacterium]